MSGSLTHNPALVIRQVLIDLGLGSDGGSTWPIYHTNEPDTPDSVITVFDQAGLQQGRTMPDSERQEAHGIQVLVRHPDEETGYAKARAIAIALDGVRQRSVTITEEAGTGTTDYKVWGIRRTSGVLSLGKDKANDYSNLFTVNALVHLRAS